MADSFQRQAKLNVLGTRSYFVSTDAGGVTLTGDQVVGVYEALASGVGRVGVLAVFPEALGFADRRIDRSLAILKRAGLIHFVAGTGWETTPEA